ncbi:hypothetical protein E8E11_005370 [Didymella keratinophila]|nr:hypothetical protein E8E11_005370 [Didymella keratinophila]
MTRDFSRYWRAAYFASNHAAEARPHPPGTYNHLRNFHALSIANLVSDMSSLKGMLDLFDRLSEDTPTNTPRATFKRESVHDIDGELELGKIDFSMEPDKPHSAEGSFDNIQLGQAETLYARAVAPKRRPPKRPYPEGVFDMLLARCGQPKTHRAKISSLLLGLAGIIVHDLFRTGENDDPVVAAPSHLALSPLYGRSQEVQESVRTKVDGQLKLDTFAEVDIVNQPLQAGALLVCFCRLHNRIATQLALIDENGRFSLPPQADSLGRHSCKDLLMKHDNDLFQTARAITCGLYMQIVVNDYICTILGLHQAGSDWQVDPRKYIDTSFCGAKFGQARGNQINLELNLTYRWHSTISTKDQPWLEQHMAKLLPNVRVENMTAQDMLLAMRQFAARQPSNPGGRTLAGLQRHNGDSFEDADLVQVLTDTTEVVAASFGPRQVPIVLKVIEIMGIQQARAWEVASFHEVRRYFGLPAHNSFADITSDPEIAKCLETLYGGVEDVELYPGVVVEEPCISSNPASAYRDDSVYTLFPFTVPSESRVIQSFLEHEADHDYDAPTFIPPPRLVSDWSSIDSILRDSRSFVAPWEARLQSLGGKQGTSAIAQDFQKERSFVKNIVFGPPDSLKELYCYVEKKTIDSVHESSERISDGYEVDIVNVATSTWTISVAHLLGIPLKAPGASQVLFDVGSLQGAPTRLFRYIFSSSKLSSVQELGLRRDALKAYQQLRTALCAT